MILSIRLLAAITVVVVLAATPALAEWVVMRVSQPARYAVDDGFWQPIEPGMEVPNHAWIHTGPSGRLLLSRSGDVIQFKPNTVAAVSRRSGGDDTTILHKFGSLLVVVEPQPNRSMSVETPYLALVVKGTRFEIDVDRSSVEVRVREGIVEATHPTAGKRADVHGGQVALAQGNRRFAVRGGRSERRIVPVAPSAPRMSPATPAREPVETSAPHSGSDDEPKPLVKRREREGRQHLIEAIRESRRDERRDRRETGSGQDRSGNAGNERDDPADAEDGSDAADAGDEPGDGPDVGTPPDLDGEPDAEVPGDAIDRSDGFDRDEALAPTRNVARATRRG